ncbi:MAG: hypothetical protein ACRCV6_00065 [Formosimonas sp.]
MKQCPQCLQQYADNINFCANDGSALRTIEAVAAPAPPPAPAAPTYSTATPLAAPQKPVLMYALIAALIAILALGLVFFIKQSNETSELKAKQEELSKVAQSVKDKEAAEKAQKAKEAKEAAATGAVKRSDSAGTKGDTALVKQPPSNVRETIDGKVMCTLVKKTAINTFGTAGYSTSQEGEELTWYYTDACGKMGVIADSQLAF